MEGQAAPLQRAVPRVSRPLTGGLIWVSLVWGRAYLLQTWT